MFVVSELINENLLKLTNISGASRDRHTLMQRNWRKSETWIRLKRTISYYYYYYNNSRFPSLDGFETGLALKARLNPIPDPSIDSDGLHI